MTLRELLDAETLERVRKYDKERKRRARDAGKHPCACGCGALVYQESVWARGHFDRHRKRTREEERDRLLLDMADALRAVLHATISDDEIWALLARLDRISTQTQGEATTSLSQEASALTSTVASGGGIGVASRAVSPCACVCDPPDQVFSRTLCACGAMHTYCGKCGEQLDDCYPDPCCEDAGDCGEDCGTA